MDLRQDINMNLHPFGGSNFLPASAYPPTSNVPLHHPGILPPPVFIEAAAYHTLARQPAMETLGVRRSRHSIAALPDPSSYHPPTHARTASQSPLVSPRAAQHLPPAQQPFYHPPGYPPTDISVRDSPPSPGILPYVPHSSNRPQSSDRDRVVSRFQSRFATDTAYTTSLIGSVAATSDSLEKANEHIKALQAEIEILMKRNVEQQKIHAHEIEIKDEEHEHAIRKAEHAARTKLLERLTRSSRKELKLDGEKVDVKPAIFHGRQDIAAQSGTQANNSTSQYHQTLQTSSSQKAGGPGEPSSRRALRPPPIRVPN